MGGTSTADLTENVGPWNPNGKNIFFGDDKNVKLNRSLVNEVEWMKNYKLSNGKQDEVAMLEKKMDEVLNL